MQLSDIPNETYFISKVLDFNRFIVYYKSHGDNYYMMSYNGIKSFRSIKDALVHLFINKISPFYTKEDKIDINHSVIEFYNIDNAKEKCPEEFI